MGQEDKSLETLAKSLLNNVVKIEVGAENGLGFVVGEKGDSLYVVTAYHVIDPAEDQTNPEIWTRNIYITFSDGVAFSNGFLQRGRLLEVRDKLATDIKDFAVIKVSKPPALYSWEKISMAPPESIKERARVLYIDRVGGIPTPDDWGYVRQANPPLWETSVKGRMQGNSGGPMLNAYGIAGMILSTERDLTRMLPINKIREWFNTRDRSSELSGAFQLLEVGKPITMNTADKMVIKSLHPAVRWPSLALGLAGLGVGTAFELKVRDDHDFYLKNELDASFPNGDRDAFFEDIQQRHTLAQVMLIGGGVLTLFAVSDKIPGLNSIYRKKETIMEGRLGLAPDIIPTYGKMVIPNSAYGFSLKLQF